MASSRIYLSPAGIVPALESSLSTGLGPRYITLPKLIAYLKGPRSSDRIQVAQHLRKSGQDTSNPVLSKLVSALLG